jgi:hypothetical protein
MPKRNFIDVQLAPEQYDRCADCPLVGLIPESERKQGKRMKFVCLGAREGLTIKPISSKGIWVRSSSRDVKHPLHRLCDSRWDAWMTLPKRIFHLSSQLYTKYRLPFEQSMQARIEFD